jgi:hypothetical protein
MRSPLLEKLKIFSGYFIRNSKISKGWPKHLQIVRKASILNIKGLSIGSVSASIVSFLKKNKQNS